MKRRTAHREAKRSAKQSRELANTSKQYATRARSRFAKSKRHELALVRDEKTTPASAVKRMRRLYERLLENYLRTPGTTYEGWTEHGPKADLDEVMAAAVDPFVFENLIERVLARAVA